MLCVHGHTWSRNVREKCKSSLLDKKIFDRIMIETYCINDRQRFLYSNQISYLE